MTHIPDEWLSTTEPGLQAGSDFLRSSLLCAFGANLLKWHSLHHLLNLSTRLPKDCIHAQISPDYLLLKVLLQVYCLTPCFPLYASNKSHIF